MHGHMQGFNLIKARSSARPSHGLSMQGLVSEGAHSKEDLISQALIWPINARAH